MNRGIVYGILCYTLWGVFPVFWKLLSEVPPVEILFHRILWSLLFLSIVLSGRRQWEWLRALRGDWRTLGLYLVAVILLFINWGVYIWATLNGAIVDASLGYFINPLVSVFLGVIFFRERLRNVQWVAIGIAALGVLYLTISYGQLPWIGLTLAFSFGIYGLLKKKGRLEAFESLTLEMLLLALPSLIGLIIIGGSGTAAFGPQDWGTSGILIATGVVTAVPLLLFAAAAQRIPLALVGILQYIAPTLQFLLGVLLYGEDFSTARVIGFGIIWFALVVFTVENVLTRRRRLRLAPVGD